MNRFSLRLPAELLAELDRQARQRRRSRSGLIREILEQHVDLSATPGHPYSRVKDLVGILSGSPPDLGARHRKHVAGLMRDRRG